MPLLYLKSDLWCNINIDLQYYGNEKLSLKHMLYILFQKLLYFCSGFEYQSMHRTLISDQPFVQTPLFSPVVLVG